MAQLKAEETKVVTIDNQTRVVDDLPEEARRLVAFYDDWKQRELEARSTLLMVQSAMRSLANEIVASIQKDAQADSQVDSNVEPVADEPVTRVVQ